MAVRLNINLSDESAAVLKELAERNGITITEAVRRSVAMYKFIDEEIRVKKRRLQTVDEANDRVADVAFL